jgi:protein-disulfide isomerase
MSKKDREGMSKRQEFREKRRRAEQRNRLITIGAIVVVVLIVAFFVIYPQIKPVAQVLPATAIPRAQTDRNAAGNPKAPVKITEYSDFQCPYCKRFWAETEPLLDQNYVQTGKVYFVDRSAGNWVSGNAGTGGTESQDSAMAALCAADQGKYWQMHDALFSNNQDVEEQGAFAPKRLQAIAQSVGLDMNAFNSCFSSQKYLTQVNQDFQDAKTAGITGTPFFVLTYTVNGQTKTETIDGAQPYSVFQQKIDAALQATGSK